MLRCILVASAHILDEVMTSTSDGIRCQPRDYDQSNDSLKKLTKRNIAGTFFLASSGVIYPRPPPKISSPRVPGLLHTFPCSTISRPVTRPSAQGPVVVCHRLRSSAGRVNDVLARIGETIGACTREVSLCPSSSPSRPSRAWSASSFA